MRLCVELRRRTGCKVITALSRTTSIDSSSRSSVRGGPRNTIRAHLESLTFDQSLLSRRDAPITFVDDLLASGTQLAAVAQLLEWEGADAEYFTGAYSCDFDDPTGPRCCVRSLVTWDEGAGYAHAREV